MGFPIAHNCADTRNESKVTLYSIVWTLQYGFWHYVMSTGVNMSLRASSISSSTSSCSLAWASRENFPVSAFAAGNGKDDVL